MILFFYSGNFNLEKDFRHRQNVKAFHLCQWIVATKCFFFCFFFFRKCGFKIILRILSNKVEISCLIQLYISKTCKLWQNNVIDICVYSFIAYLSKNMDKRSLYSERWFSYFLLESIIFSNLRVIGKKLLYYLMKNIEFFQVLMTL